MREEKEMFCQQKDPLQASLTNKLFPDLKWINIYQSREDNNNPKQACHHHAIKELQYECEVILKFDDFWCLKIVGESCFSFTLWNGILPLYEALPN